MKPLPNIGERLAVHGMSGFVTLVASVAWDKHDQDWLINLDWEQYGASRVWTRDEGSVWQRWVELN